MCHIYLYILGSKGKEDISEKGDNPGQNIAGILYRYIMFGRGICEKYHTRDEKFPEPNGEGNLVSRLVFFANIPPKHDISV